MNFKQIYLFVSVTIFFWFSIYLKSFLSWSKYALNNSENVNQNNILDNSKINGIINNIKDKNLINNKDLTKNIENFNQNIFKKELVKNTSIKPKVPEKNSFIFLKIKNTNCNTINLDGIKDILKNNNLNKKIKELSGINLKIKYNTKYEILNNKIVEQNIQLLKFYENLFQDCNFNKNLINILNEIDRFKVPIKLFDKPNFKNLYLKYLTFEEKTSIKQLHKYFSELQSREYLILLEYEEFILYFKSIDLYSKSKIINLMKSVKIDLKDFQFLMKIVNFIMNSKYVTSQLFNWILANEITFEINTKNK